jgi:putative ATP-dependent endonuclease of OLD family
MARIRKIEINNFRSIKALTWLPSPGINCLIGPGDSGKSSVIDAIDFCLGARRNIQFTDADFHYLDVDSPISISVTIGELDDALKSMETYGLFVRGFDSSTGMVEDEPEKDIETVLTLNLTIANDLEPAWKLISDRAAAQNQARNLSWGDRVRLAPTRVGAVTDFNLGWRRGSVLNRLSEERPDASAALAKAAREARAAFGDEADKQLGETLAVVAGTAKELGIPVGDHVKAMLDAHSVSFSGGTISLHDEDGIPLRGLGVGSTRLLIAGLLRKAAAQSTVVLIDELEHGLEPHRIIRLLGSLGAKEQVPPLQAFVTTHSPVALRELSGEQLHVVRAEAKKHLVVNVGTADDVQSAIRLYPDAFLAPSVVICEGASEVGLVRGMDQYWSANGYTAMTAHGVALVDCGGGDSDRPFHRAAAFGSLGYRTAVIRDDDKKPTENVEAEYKKKGGLVITWRAGRALEDELFASLSDAGVEGLVKRATELHGEELVDEHIKSASKNVKNLNAILMEPLIDGAFTAKSRTILGIAARTKRAGWFKSVTKMEAVARDIVGPDLENADPGFRSLVEDIFAWIDDAKT